MFVERKSEWWGYWVVKKSDDILSCSNTDHKSWTHTDMSDKQNVFSICIKQLHVMHRLVINHKATLK